MQAATAVATIKAVSTDIAIGWELQLLERHASGRKVKAKGQVRRRGSAAHLQLQLACQGTVFHCKPTIQDGLPAGIVMHLLCNFLPPKDRRKVRRH